MHGQLNIKTYNACQNTNFFLKTLHGINI